jgi:hypothetical protein
MPHGELRQRHDRHQGVVEVVGDAAGERAQRVQLLRMPQLTFEVPLPLLGGLQLGYVAEDDEGPARRLAFFGQRRDLGLHHPGLAVGANDAEPRRRPPVAAAEGVPHRGQHRPILFVNKRQKRRKRRLGHAALQAQQTIELVRPLVDPGHVVAQDAAGLAGALGERQVLLASGQLSLRCAQLGHVLDGDEQADRVAAFVKGHLRLAVQGAHLAVGSDDAVFHGLRLGAAPGRDRRGAHSFAVVSMHPLDEILRRRLEACAIDAIEVEDFVGAFDLAGPEIAVDTAHGADVLGAQQVLLAAAKLPVAFVARRSRVAQGRRDAIHLFDGRGYRRHRLVPGERVGGVGEDFHAAGETPADRHGGADRQQQHAGGQ